MKTPQALLIVPVRNMVLFPGMVVPIAIGRKGSVDAAQLAVSSERPIGILLQTDPQVDVPGPADLAPVGTVATILRFVNTPNDEHYIICQGLQRFRVCSFLPNLPYLAADVENLDDTVDANNPEIEARHLQLKERALEALQLLPQAPQ